MHVEISEMFSFERGIYKTTQIVLLGMDSPAALIAFTRFSALRKELEKSAVKQWRRNRVLFQRG